MDRFAYRAYTDKGDIVKGVLEAHSHGEALQLLRGRGLIPFASCLESASAKRGFQQTHRRGASRSVGEASRLAFVYELGILLRAQMPLDHALQILPQQPDLKTAVPTIRGIADAVASGGSLAEALAAQPGFLLPHQTAMIKAAEHTGSVAEILLQLASAMRRQIELRARVRAALTYPAILLCMSMATMALVATVLVPSLLPLFEAQQTSPPLIIRVFIALNTNFSAILVLLAAAAGGAALIARRLGMNEAFLLFRDGALPRLPVIGSMLIQAETIRIATALGLLLKNGAALSQALIIVQKTTKNRAIQRAIAAANERVVAGSRVARAFAECAVMPSSCCHLAAVGEEANRLDEMMLHIAQMNEAALHNRLERMMTLLTPTLTLIMGLLVAGLITAVMKAILSVNDMALP
ncbi:MAG TPA: type II secretion system F family protein [Aestuariivirgaceae bacterium]